MLYRQVCGALAVMASAGTVQAATPLWWDTDFARRFNVAVTTGPSAPDRGYAGYTVRIAPLDTQSLIAAGELQSNCADLRMTYYDGIAWQDLPRHILGCNTADTDIRFALPADIASGATDDNYYLYYGNAAAGAAPAMSEDNVYLWFDDASTDRSAAYTRGRIDSWHGTGWDNSLSWNAGGYYVYDNGDNFTSGYRRNIDERDVYVEAEFFHTGCYQFNITSGVLLRGANVTGSAGSESTNTYYASNRGEYPGCSTAGYTHDGDILSGNRQTTAIDGPNPPDLIANVWRRQALAAWLTAPNNLAFWDEDTSSAFAAPGFPAASNLQASGTDAAGASGRGFAGIMTAQDRARVRNILMRRYVNPEPSLALVPESQPANLVLQKSVLTVYDPVNNTSNPKAIPGSWVDYTLSATNSGSGSADVDSLLIVEPVPANAALFVADLAGAGSGPVEFIDGSGAASSGLSLQYGGPGDAGDDIEFSTDGVDYSYTPVPDVDGFDALPRFLRIRPSGAFAGAAGGTPTQFSVRVRVRIQ